MAAGVAGAAAGAQALTKTAINSAIATKRELRNIFFFSLEILFSANLDMLLL